jgi:hypothetical protein
MLLQQVQQRLLVCVPLLCRALYDFNFVGFRDHREISGYKRAFLRVVWIIIAFDALRKSLGFVSNGFLRWLHFSKIEF